MTEAYIKQVDKNYKAFKKKLPDIIADHNGEYALMHDKEIVGYFSTPKDAFIYGIEVYPDGLFSIQEVSDKLVYLGYSINAFAAQKI